MPKSIYTIKNILLGTLVVSMVPSTFVFLRNWALGDSPNPEMDTLTAYLISLLFSVVVTFSIFLAVIKIISGTTAKLEGKISAPKRILICLVLSLIVANIIIYIYWLIFNAFLFHCEAEEARARIFENQMLATVLVIIVSLVFEIGHYIHQLKITVAEKERLEKENMRSQLESLKTQMSPHFLFNSFNALLSLIDSDKEKAKQFLMELSKVYRYVLEQKDNLVVELKEELKFINSYIYLNKIRFGENLHFETDIDAGNLSKFIPPLTLQSLVENAIKHNIISESKPLTIKITNDRNRLIVSNNLQGRNEKIVSTGIGLKNLKERYFLLGNSEPEFGIVNDQYIAKIPLIEKENI
ncbi:MAG: histidine kinase [Chitinophagales bacterium]|nr:histidine kinase [Chitinophagales bacterium]